MESIKELNEIGLNLQYVTYGDNMEDYGIGDGHSIKVNMMVLTNYNNEDLINAYNSMTKKIGVDLFKCKELRNISSVSIRSIFGLIGEDQLKLYDGMINSPLKEEDSMEYYNEVILLTKIHIDNNHYIKFDEDEASGNVIIDGTMPLHVLHALIFKLIYASEKADGKDFKYVVGGDGNRIMGDTEFGLGYQALMSL